MRSNILEQLFAIGSQKAIWQAAYPASSKIMSAAKREPHATRHLLPLNFASPENFSNATRNTLLFDYHRNPRKTEANYVRFPNRHNRLKMNLALGILFLIVSVQADLYILRTIDICQYQLPTRQCGEMATTIKFGNCRRCIWS